MPGTFRKSGTIIQQLEQGSTPTTPDSGYGIVYPKSDGKWYSKNSAGVEVQITNPVLSELSMISTPVIQDSVLLYDSTNSDALSKTTLHKLLETYTGDYMNNHFEYFNDFINAVAVGTTGQDIVSASSGAGAGNSAVNSTETNRTGQIRLTTGTTSTGRSSISSSVGSVRFSGGRWIYEVAINITQLSTSSERFQLLVGFADVYSSPDQVDAAYFLYDEGGVSTGSAASANWQIVTSNNSTRTFTTSSTAISAGSWVTLRVDVNEDGTSVSFLINGSSIGTHTTNIPTGSTRLTGFGNTIYKSIGTTAVTFDLDYLRVRKNFTTPR